MLGPSDGELEQRETRLTARWADPDVLPTVRVLIRPWVQALLGSPGAPCFPFPGPSEVFHRRLSLGHRLPGPVVQEVLGFCELPY